MSFLRGALGAFLLSCGVVACGGSKARPNNPAPDGGTDSPSADPVTVLGQASLVDVGVADLDGDGIAEIVLWPHADSKAPASPTGTSPQALTSALPDGAVVLSHDTGGNLVIAQSLTFTNFAALKPVFTASGVEVTKQLGKLLGDLTSGGDHCAAAIDAMGFVSAVAKAGITVVQDELEALAFSIEGLPYDPMAPLAADADENIVTCLTRTPQTPVGCFIIDVVFAAEVACARFSNPPASCDLVKRRAHCYQVNAPAGSTCPSPAARSVLCDKATDHTGCCNPEFVYQTILLADVRNNAPNAASPATGPIGPSQTVILNGPQDVGDFLVDLVPQVLPQSAAGVINCLASSVGLTQNPIQLTTGPDPQAASASAAPNCATNTALTGHILQGSVTQCVRDDGNQVYSTINGYSSSTARLAGLNEKAGPRILGTVAAHLQAQVARVLGDIAANGMCCKGASLVGGTASNDANGDLQVTASGAGGMCNADGGTDAADGSVPTAGGPDMTLTQTGTLTHGQMLPYTFAANAGNGVEIRATRTSGNIVPVFQVHDPNGTVVAAGTGSSFTVTGADFVTKTGGTFTVDVYDQTTVSTASGNFTLVIAVAPGADSGGALVPGKVKTSSLVQGALDSYTFAAAAGQGIQLRLTAKTSGFGASFTVYDPSGAVAATSSGAAAVIGGADFSAKTSGVYTLILSDGTTGRAGSGPYDLFFTLAPAANEGTPLVPGVPAAAMLVPGGLDAYTFDAQAGQAVQLRVAEQLGASFTATFAVYGPTGTLVITGQTSSTIVAGADFSIKSAGTYTIVVYDGSTGRGGSGPYILYCVVAPGTAGTTLTPGAVVSSQLAEGALDAYTFAAQAGKTISVRPGDADGGAFPFSIAVYDPSGKLVGSANYGPVTFAAQTSGTFTAVVYDGTTGRARTGQYSMSFTTN